MEIIVNQKHSIVWTGENLREVIDLIGKWKEFSNWFKSFEEYENYVHAHNNVLKLYVRDKEYYEVYPGCEIEKDFYGSWKPVTKQKFKYIIKPHNARKEE